jgi:catechol 2,3-dioxygenase-like lactoylglutathione lyase family enzyme
VIFGAPIQVGVIVADVHATIERRRAVFGEEDWLIVENGPQNMRALYVRGEPAEYSMRLGLLGESPQLELLQPLEGDDILAEWLSRRGEGLHHLGYRVDSVDEAIERMQKAGHPCIQHGYGFNPDGSGAFAYFDTEAELGHLVEALEL